MFYLTEQQKKNVRNPLNLLDLLKQQTNNRFKQVVVEFSII